MIEKFILVFDFYKLDSSLEVFEVSTSSIWMIWDVKEERPTVVSSYLCILINTERFCPRVGAAHEMRAW